MTGPPYPHPDPAPGSNAIGSFTIGVSPIGTIAQFDPWATIISQYSNSPALTGIITAFNAAMDLTGDMDDFFDFIWNVQTANGYGLDVWGAIVGVSRILSIPGAASYFGFEEAGTSWTGFGQGGLYSGGGSSSNFVLSDDDFRKLVLAKAAGNISDGSNVSINSILLALFPPARGLCYVQDNLDMSVTLVFSFKLTPPELAIIQQSGVLPISAGVIVTVSQPP